MFQFSTMWSSTCRQNYAILFYIYTIPVFHLMFILKYICILRVRTTTQYKIPVRRKNSKHPNRNQKHLTFSTYYTYSCVCVSSLSSIYVSPTARLASFFLLSAYFLFVVIVKKVIFFVIPILFVNLNLKSTKWYILLRICVCMKQRREGGGGRKRKRTGFYICQSAQNPQNPLH